MNQDIKKLRHELPPYLEKPQKKEKLWTRNFLSIFFINVCMFMSFHMLTPTFPYYIKSLGGTDHLAGIAAAAISVAALLVRPFSGWFMDNKGRKVLFMIGIVVMVATTFYYNTIQLVMLAVIFRFIQGLGWGVSNTGSNTLAADSIPRNRFAEGMGFFSLTAAISLAVAPALGLWSISHYDYQMLFLISGLFAVGSLVLAFIYQYRPLSQKREIKPLFIT
jgi:MFS family permease